MRVKNTENEKFFTVLYSQIYSRKLRKTDDKHNKDQDKTTNL